MKTKLIKLLSLIMAALLITATLAACSSQPQETDTQPATSSEQETLESKSDEREITLVADFSSGSERAEELDLLRKSTVTVEEATPQAMADALSEWSGLDFTVSITVDGAVVTVDWSEESTLLAGLGDREQKEDFFFYDHDSLCWFMLDSLYSTLKENLGDIEVYYTMDGGQDLIFDQLYPVNTFPADIQYMGSPFYFAHADTQGES